MKTLLRTTMVGGLLLAVVPAVEAQTKHRRPYKATVGVSAHYDADGIDGNGAAKDYQCNGDSYDGHSGTDYRLPLGSKVVASAPGTVTRTNDGCENHGSLGNSCGGYLGNWVEIEHADGSQTMYGHMKRGSLAVSAGDNVTCGQVVGESASSGSSTGPHLHFAWRPSSSGDWSISSTREPYAGACGRNNSLFVDQGTYQGDPSPQCADRERDIDIWVDSTGIEDRLTQGTSDGTLDALPEQTFESSIYIKNKSGRPIRDVELGYIIEEPYLVATDYVIESDVSGGGQFGVNDADAHEGNPPKDGLGKEGVLTMYAFAAGETKRVRITISAAEPNLGKDDQDHPDVRGFVHNIRDVYHQETWGDEPSPNNADEKLTAYIEHDILTRSAWEFESDETEMLEGWTPCDQGVAEAAIDPNRQRLVVRTDAADACLTSPPWTRVDADTLQQMELVITSDAAPHGATLRWNTTGDETFGDDRALDFRVPDGDGPAVIDLRQHPKWQGDIQRLRLDLVDQSAAGAEVTIDAIRFQPADGDFDSDADTGIDTDTGVEPDPDTDTGVEPGPDAGAEPDLDAGFESDADAGFAPDAVAAGSTQDTIRTSSGCGGGGNSQSAGFVLFLLGLAGLGRHRN